MRLEAGDPGATEYSVFHVPTCKLLQGVAWVDDDTAQWAQYETAYGRFHPQLPKLIRQARRIYINTDNKVVLIDPVDFDDALLAIVEAELRDSAVDAIWKAAERCGEAIAEHFVRHGKFPWMPA